MSMKELAKWIIPVKEFGKGRSGFVKSYVKGKIHLETRYTPASLSKLLNSFAEFEVIEVTTGCKN